MRKFIASWELCLQLTKNWARLIHLVTVMQILTDITKNNGNVASVLVFAYIQRKNIWFYVHFRIDSKRGDFALVHNTTHAGRNFCVISFLMI